jgi:hypothetical protein
MGLVNVAALYRTNKKKMSSVVALMYRRRRCGGSGSERLVWVSWSKARRFHGGSWCTCEYREVSAARCERHIDQCMVFAFCEGRSFVVGGISFFDLSYPDQPPQLYPTPQYYMNAVFKQSFTIPHSIIPKYFPNTILIMCLLFHYIYHCHPSASETLFRPCYRDSTQHTRTDIQKTQNHSSHPRCPRLLEKKISSPSCVACMVRMSDRGVGIQGRDEQYHWHEYLQMRS